MRIPSSHLRRLLIFSFAFTTFIKAGAQLHADFTSNIQQGCSPLIVQFTDVSTGNPTEWFWDLGNGATSSDSFPSAFYFNPGSYTVKLHIKNTTGEDSVIKSNYITVYDKPSIAFTASPSEGCAPLNVQFTDLSKAGSGNILSWIWDFGDGMISTSQNPLHTYYNVLDTFNVLLTVTNSFGCKNTLTEPSLIKIKGVVIAGFSYKYNTACKAPDTVKFTNASQSTQFLTYQWSFGDGTPVNTLKNPDHIYATTGNFTVKLTVTNASGCSDTYSQAISIGSTITDFTFTNPCLNAPAIFTDSSTPKPLNEIWNFGDGTTDSGYQVSHTYTTGSSYNVTLTADFGGCINTKTKTIQINEKPLVDFKATTNRNTCMVPDTVQFFGSLQNAVTFKWLFGDGSTSTDINPTHIYKAAGKFTVSLLAYNANGCSDTVVKENFVQIGPPQIQGVANLPFGGCAPQTLRFNPIIDFNSTITSYSWDFGDGSTSTNAVPVHQYKKTGIYNVTLMVSSVEGCKDTLLMPGAISLGKAPTALFDAWPVDVCGKKPIKFKDTSSGLPTSWLWFFGDAYGSSTDQNPTHTYVDTGYFDITLIASQYGCNDTLVKIGYIHVNPPVAKFGYTSYCKNLYTYYFSDSSISPKTWYWDFGDGNTSTSQNPTHTYGSKGIFVVSLTVTNSGCSYTRSDTLNIIRESPSIQYEFLSPNSCKYDSIRFSAANYDTTNVKSIKWDFGDSVTAYQKWNEDFIYHFYNDAGTYFPLLIIKDINNCMDTIDTHTQVQVFGPKAAFSNVSGDCLLSTIKFNDESSSDGIDPVTTWIWDFGDGTPPETLTAPPFEHTYTSTGTFSVSLKVIDKNNCYDTITNISNLSISRPVADFIATDTISCSQSPVQFIDSSKGAVSLTYKWNFGDGMYSYKSNPMHAFAHEGLYNVKLIITDQFNCADSIMKPKYIRVADPRASFILMDSLFLCPPAKISPINTSVNYSSLLWDFGDGNTSSATMPDHYYNAVGSYTLRLIATGYGHCSDTFTKSLVLKGPLAELNYSPLTGCAPLHVSFTAKAVNTLKYLWDFGNGVLKTTSLPSTNYTYTIPGDFLPQLVVVDSSGCQVPVTIPDTIVVGGAKANYLVSTKEGICDSSLYNFTDSSVVSFDKILSYNWRFGDGDSSSGINSYHYYTHAGLYNTSLNITTENGCVASYQVPINVLIDSTPQVFATFPDTACINAPVSLSAGVTNNSPRKFSWLWSLGNGDSRNTNNATYSYSTPGTYNLYVVGTSLAGCSDTVFHTTRIGPLPFTDAGSDMVICRGESAHLTATGADAYTWSHTASLSCTTCPGPVATPLRNTTYFLTGVNSFGCKEIDSVNIQVKQPIHVSISAPGTICIGSSIQLTAKGAELYNWQPASQVTNSTGPMTASTPSSTTKYSVVGSDNAGCFTDTASLTVNVSALPTVQLPDSIVTVNAGSGYQAEAKGSPDIISWNWSPLTGLSCSACADPLITPPENETYTVEVKNITGCKGESHISFIVTCKGQNLFIPNTFSPNADGMNDYFYPRGKGIMNVQLFRVFSRWGTVVYERTNFPPNQQSYGWDGNYNGKALQADVYVFIAEVACENGEIISLKGNVTLLR